LSESIKFTIKFTNILGTYKLHKATNGAANVMLMNAWHARKRHVYQQVDAAAGRRAIACTL